MKELRCIKCGEYTEFKPYQTNLYKYEGERVKKCKKCGHLRTENNRRAPESQMIHIPTQKKYSEMED